MTPPRKKALIDSRQSGLILSAGFQVSGFKFQDSRFRLQGTFNFQFLIFKSQFSIRFPHGQPHGLSLRSFCEAFHHDGQGSAAVGEVSGVVCGAYEDAAGGVGLCRVVVGPVAGMDADAAAIRDVEYQGQQAAEAGAHGDHQRVVAGRDGSGHFLVRAAVYEWRFQRVADQLPGLVEAGGTTGGGAHAVRLPVFVGHQDFLEEVTAGVLRSLEVAFQ